MSSQFIIALGVVTAALIAGFFSFLNLVISKEQKVSEFRQEWIDKLRDDVSQYISSISFLAVSHLNKNIANENVSIHEYTKSIEAYYDSSSRTYTSIYLRINPDDKDPVLKKHNKKLLGEMVKVGDALEVENYSEAVEIATGLRDFARPILKIEWERVKSGEKMYRWSRFAAGAILVAGLVALGVGTAYYITHGNSVSTSANKPIQIPKNSALMGGIRIQTRNIHQ